MKNRMNQRSSHGRTENKSDSESRSDQPHPSCTIFICGYIRNIGLCCRDIPPHGPRYYTGEEKHRQGFCKAKNCICNYRPECTDQHDGPSSDPVGPASQNRRQDQLHERVDTVEKPDRNRRSRKLTRIKWQQWQYDAKTEQVDDYNQKDSRKGGSIHKMALTGRITGSGYYLHAQTRQAIETKVANINSIH